MQRRQHEPGIEAHGFTNRVLGWDAWLDVVEFVDASSEQITVLEESHLKAKESDLLPVPRASAGNPAAALGRLQRNHVCAGRGAGAGVDRRFAGQRLRVLRVGACVAVRATGERDDVIEQVFNDPATAGTSPREKAIVPASIDLTLRPGQVEPAQLRALRDAGLSDDEILDPIHSIAIFAWANRLMLNLGQPVG